MCLGPIELTPPFSPDLFIRCCCVWLKTKTVTQVTLVSLERQEQHSIRKHNDPVKGSWFRTCESFWNTQTSHTTSIPHVNKTHTTPQNKVKTCQNSGSAFPVRSAGEAPSAFENHIPSKVPVRQVKTSGLQTEDSYLSRPHPQMWLTVHCPTGRYLGPKYRAGKARVEVAGDARSNERPCQQTSGPGAEEITAAGHSALNSGSYKLTCCLWSRREALGTLVSCPPSHPAFAAQTLNSVKPKASRDWIQVPNLHCSQVHPLWRLSAAGLRPGETILHPLSPAYRDLLSQGFLYHLSLLSLEDYFYLQIKNSFVLPHVGICWSSDPCRQAFHFSRGCAEGAIRW